MENISRNILVNCIITVAFVYLNMWALENGLEETFITFAICFGVVVIVFNAIYISKLSRKKGN